MTLGQLSLARGSMDRLFRPRSIAIVGASATRGSFGESVLSNLDAADFGGDLHLINPNRTEVHGRKCLPSIETLPDDVDCAVLAIPGSAVVEAAEACARRKVGSLIVFSAGFAESGEEGRAAQTRLREIAERHGMVIEGPNCLGIVNYVDRIPLTFVSTAFDVPAEERSLAILSQSGAMAAVLSVNLQHHGIGLAYSISTGNEAAYGVEEFLEHLLDDDHCRVLTMIVEQFRQPRRFLALAEKARASGKRIVLLHPGSSSAGRASAATHTGALAGDHRLMRHKVIDAGVVLVESLEELVDVSQLLVRAKGFTSRGPAIITESGAFKAIALDLCESLSLEVPPLSRENQVALREALPAFIPPSNPLDLTAHALVDPDLYRRTLPAFVKDNRFGSLLLGIILTDNGTASFKFTHILESLRAIAPPKPIVFAALDEGAMFPREYVHQLNRLGVPFFPSPERALRALARVTAVAEPEARFSASEVKTLPPLHGISGEMPEYKSKQILAALGIRVPAGQLATTPTEARAIAQRIGFPVALKIQSVDLPHKSDVGGVVLHLQNVAQLDEGWERLQRSVATAMPGTGIDGVLVERMETPGVELILGVRNDPHWGPVLLAGLGGVLAEVLEDVRLLSPALSVEGIVAELHRLKGAQLLRGFRGAPQADVPAAAEVLHLLGQLVTACPQIKEIDINPLIVYPAGQGAVALDALILAEEQ